MKNMIPMVLAAILAAAAVFAVSRLVRSGAGPAERPLVDVVAAAQEIPPDGVIQEAWLVRRPVDAASAPAKAVAWQEAYRLVGQRASRTIPAGDYVQLSDVAGLTPSFDQLVPEGEWAVPLTFSDSALVPFLEPGMEVAILGTFAGKRTVTSADASQAPQEVSEESTSVVFPCVRILDVGRGDGIRRERGGRGGGMIVVAMTPRMAATLVAVQRTMELYPALRRRRDRSSLHRRDVGVVNEATIQGFKKDLETVEIPDGMRQDGTRVAP